MLYVFKNDDLGYLQWVGENQSGYILNTRKIPDPDYMVLHRARCSTIKRYHKGTSINAPTSTPTC